MDAVKEKLKSSRGATIIFALMFFLIAAIIGSIVLASASSNAGRLSHMRDEQQAYLTISSAASLLAAELEGVSFHDDYTVYNEDDVPSPLADKYKSGSPKIQLTSGKDSVKDIVTTLVEAVYDSRSPLSDNELEIEFDIKPEGDTLDVVKVRLVISQTDNSKYALKAYLSLDGAEKQYPMTLTVPVSFEESTPSGSIQDSYMKTVKRENEETGESEYVQEEEIVWIPFTRTVVDIKYGKGTITKGGA